MGILDDVTHAGDQPDITLPENAERKFFSFEITDEELVEIKDWLVSATDEEKETIEYSNITRINYSHPRLPVRPTLTAIRTKFVELSDLKSLPNIKNYYTMAYSNIDPFEYTNTISVDLDPDAIVVKAYIVLDGSLKINGIVSKVFSPKEIVYFVEDSENENIMNSGEENSLILGLTLA